MLSKENPRSLNIAREYVLNIWTTVDRLKIYKEAYIEVENPHNTRYSNVDTYKRDIWIAK